MPQLISPHLDPRLRDYIESVQLWCRAGPPTRERIDELRALASNLANGPIKLSPNHRRVPTTGYGRNRLHHDPTHNFVVLAMIWPPNTGGLPHDHQTWGVVAITQGKLEITDYTSATLHPADTHAELRQRSQITGTRGATAYVLPPHEDIHAVRNPDPHQTAISIHTYGHEINRCRTFDPTGTITWVTPEYHDTPSAP